MLESLAVAALARALVGVAVSSWQMHLYTTKAARQPGGTNGDVGEMLPNLESVKLATAIRAYTLLDRFLTNAAHTT